MVRTGLPFTQLVLEQGTNLGLEESVHSLLEFISINSEELLDFVPDEFEGDPGILDLREVEVLMDDFFKIDRTQVLVQ